MFYASVFVVEHGTQVEKVEKNWNIFGGDHS